MKNGELKVSLQVKYNNIVLDISTDLDSEMERTSPLFLLDDFLAEYSTPLTIKYSDKNARALGFLFFELTTKVKTTLDVEVFTDGTFRGRGTLVVESAGMNRDFQQKSTLTGYLVTGITNFFTLIKDKKLSQLTLGGPRTFAWTSDDPEDGSDGWWQHVLATADFNDDYVFPPFINEFYTDDDPEFFGNGSGYINKWTGTVPDVRFACSPWTKISYLLNQIFAEHNWMLDTSELDGSDWDKFILWSNRNISTNGYGFDEDEDIVRTHLTSFVVNLPDHMPTDVLCSNFIFELCKRFFWYPLCDGSTRTCKIIPLNNLRTASVKDWTKYAGAASTSDFTVAEKIYAFKNEFVGEDGKPNEPDLTQFNNEYNRYTSINGAPDPSLFTPVLIFAWLQNKFYNNAYVDNAYAWADYGDNIFGENPDNATDTFNTQVAPVPMQLGLFDNGFHGFVPVFNQAPFTKFGMRTALYHGLSKEVDNSYAPVSPRYPFAGSIASSTGGSAELAFSDIWKHPAPDTSDDGIYETWAKDFLQMISPAELIERRFYLPLYELARFKWSDVIAISNIPYFIKSYVEPLSIVAPDKFFIQAKLQRIKLFAKALPAEADDSVRFGTEIVLGTTGTTYSSNQPVLGPAGATVTIKVTTYSNSDPGVMRFYVNTVERFLDDEFDITLDGSGHAEFSVLLSGAHNVDHTNALDVILTIEATDTGTLGSPLTHGYDLIIL
jgi:hypothetical protein